MASCGRGSVRLWRLRSQALRSCPVDLGEYQALEFTDLAFRQAQDSSTLYVCGSSGHIVEIDPPAHGRVACSPPSARADPQQAPPTEADLQLR